jgi:transcriptional regulator with XRE-family HTH domain
MAQSLGDRIKALRKSLNMTQTDLAGSEMTKSMLSQIENNLATPSMKNLQYLASRLGKPASYFLEDEAYVSSLPIEEIHQELKEISSLINSRKLDEALSMLEAMHSKYDFDRDSKLYADFLSNYGECLIELNRSEEGEEKIKAAVNIYKNKYLFVDASRTYIILIGTPWNNFDYQKCMNILEEALSIYNNSIHKDYAFEIETLYIRSILFAGLDKIEDSLLATNKALSISKQTDIYYKSDELYKNLAVMGGLLGELEHFNEHIDKARQFAVFTDNNRVLASVEGVCGLYYNKLGKPEKALEYLDTALELSNKVAAFALAEKAKSFYMLGQYQQALESIKHIEYPDYIPFKYDYLHIWNSKVYEGLSLSKIGRSKEAAGTIKTGIEMLKIVGESKALVFAYKSLSEVYSDMDDFENAFAALKKSNEIEELAKDNKLYY